MLGAVAAGTSGPRRPDATAEQLAKRERTWAEVRAVAAEFHARLPRDAATAVGAAYARYSTRFQDSVADQVRAIFADAAKKGVFIPAGNVFFDLGVRGFKSDREGLNALRACLDRKAAGVVFFFATNRLFRKTYKSLQFVEEQVVEKGARAVFVKSGVDTADAHRWRQALAQAASNDEYAVGMNVENIRAAHEGLLGKGLVFGTVTFGYAGDPIPGEFTRRGRPRRRLTVDPAAAGYVRSIFRWVVADRVTVAEVVRRLNADSDAPPPPRSPDRRWTRQAVVGVLKNPRYRGRWRYGATETVWKSSKDYARQVARPEPLKEVQVEDLRVVPDDLWHAAQDVLAREAGRAAGRAPRDPVGAALRRATAGLFYCRAHGRRLYAGGAGGGYLLCKGCQGLPAADRPLFSHLPRALALRRLCESLADLVRADGDLVGRVAAACRTLAAKLQAPDPGRVAALAEAVAGLDRRIRFVLGNPGEADADLAESGAELRRLRAERATAQAELERVRAAAGRAVAVPADAEVEALMAGMGDALAAAAAAPDLEGAGLVRELIDRLTGGRVEVEQAGVRSAHRGWLRGRFRPRVVEAAVGQLSGTGAGGPAEAEAAVDFREGPPGPPPGVAAVAVALYDAGRLMTAIAAELGLTRAGATAAVDAGLAAAGRARADGRTRRKGLARKSVAPPPSAAAADRVKELADGGMLLVEIAAELGLDRHTAAAAWRHWHASRGLPVPDGRTRRKALARKARPAKKASDATQISM